MSSIDCDERYFSEFFCVEGWEGLKDKAIKFVKKYDQLLTKIMEHMGIKSEAEIMVSVVTSLGKYASASFHEVEELQEQLERQVRKSQCSLLLLIFVLCEGSGMGIGGRSARLK